MNGLAKSLTNCHRTFCPVRLPHSIFVRRWSYSHFNRIRPNHTYCYGQKFRPGAVPDPVLAKFTMHSLLTAWRWRFICPCMLDNTRESMWGKCVMRKIQSALSAFIYKNNTYPENPSGFVYLIETILNDFPMTKKFYDRVVLNYFLLLNFFFRKSFSGSLQLLKLVTSNLIWI